ncbi:MAG TPA: hypothetical protein VFT65_01715, partial [Candidatus Angelobacter sp.]|nr:hypothetical protein [Candidatus Angelobacter sp.]
MFNIIPRPRHGNAPRRLTSLAVALVLALLAGHAFAESAQDLHLKFVNVVDSTQGLSDFSQFPALNNHGDVAFLAFQNGSEQDVFK